MKIKNILSLFDGISCGQVALKRAGIQYDRYYASEIDKNCIKVTQKRHPKTIQLGSVTDIKLEDLPEIDLLLAGSPCQGFSVAGTGLNFEHPKSKLFFDFVRILEEVKPKYFLLENVRMKKEWEDIITKYVGVSPIEINSSLVSAQHRRRLYWTNIPNVEQPSDLQIFLKDIEEHNQTGLFIDHTVSKIPNHVLKNGREIKFSKTLSKPYSFFEGRTDFGKAERKRLRKLLGCDTTPRNSKTKGYFPQSHRKANCLVTSVTMLDYIVDSNSYFRELTNLEKTRLQTLPDDYFKDTGLSDRQIHKALGNGWTVSVIAHILSYI